MDNRPATIFCDIDGTLTKHTLPTVSQLPSNKMELLDKDETNGNNSGFMNLDDLEKNINFEIREQ